MGSVTTRLGIGTHLGFQCIQGRDLAAELLCRAQIIPLDGHLRAFLVCLFVCFTNKAVLIILVGVFMHLVKFLHWRVSISSAVD